MSKVNHKNTKCCKCGSGETSTWYRYFDENGNWNGKSYRCSKCYKISYNQRYESSVSLECPYYKSLRIYDGKPRWVLTDGQGNIIDTNPDKDQIKLAIIDNSAKKKKCCKCGCDNSFPNFYNHICDKENCTGSLCVNCRRYEYYHKVESNMIKLNAQIRNNILDRDVSLSKSIVDQAVVAEYLGVEDLNIKMNNFNYYIDIEHEKHGKVDVKGGTLKTSKGSFYWQFGNHNKIEPDTYFCLGYDILRDNIISAWIVPNDDWVICLDNMRIYRNPSRTTKYDYQQFEIPHIECRKLDDIYKNLDIDRLFERIAKVLTCKIVWNGENKKWHI